MTQSEHEKFSELLTNTLINADIKYASGADGEAYVVYNDFGVLFSITFHKKINKFLFNPTELFKSECQKHGLPVDATIDYKTIFESVDFTYKIRQVAEHIKKDISLLYRDLLIDSDIIFQMRGHFETYMVTNSGVNGYAIGYNNKTEKYGFKRYKLVNTLYKVCNIPSNNKPDFASLYKKTKDAYMAQIVVEGMSDFEIY